MDFYFLGFAERSLELMKSRVKTRVAFGQPLVNQGTIQQDIALSRYHLPIPRSSMQYKRCVYHVWYSNRGLSSKL
jgi:hypothetical protein